MVRDRQHGPVIELNRMAIHRKTTASISLGEGKSAAGKIFFSIAKPTNDYKTFGCFSRFAKRGKFTRGTQLKDSFCSNGIKDVISWTGIIAPSSSHLESEVCWRKC